MQPPSPERFIASLMERMSLAEKVGQLVGTLLPAPSPAEHLLDDDAVAAPPGIIAVPPLGSGESNQLIRQVQEELVTRTRLGIPALTVALAPPSGATRFPAPIARAATWDVHLVARVAAAAARESRASGVLGQLSPGVTLAAGSTPARQATCFGGSPLLAAELVAAHVAGAQGPAGDRIDGEHVAAAAVDLGGLGRFPGSASMTDLDARSMRSCVLAAGQAAVRAGVAMVVPTRGGNDGLPAHLDTTLLRTLLRDEWGFDGTVLAAPGALAVLVHEHRVAEDLDAAGVLAWEAGIDAVLTSIDVPDRGSRIAMLVQRGSLPSWLIDDAVAALLRLKWRLDLWTDPYPPAPAPVPVGAAGALADETAVESLVLLADPAGALPLRPTPELDLWAPGDQGPGGSALADALSIAGSTKVRHCTATSAPEGAEPLVAVLPNEAAEAAMAEVRRAAATGRPCVVLVPPCRADALSGLLELPAAVLLCWDALAEQPGAVARVLVGADEPGGRLPVALSDPSGSLPLGHGGGYTTFAYSGLQVPPRLPDGGRPLVVRFRLTNTGSRPGKEVVQVYLWDRFGSVATSARVLACFTTVRLGAGRSSRVSLQIPAERFTLWNRSMDEVVEPGSFDVMVGRSAGDIRLTAQTVLDLPDTARRVPHPAEAGPIG